MTENGKSLHSIHVKDEAMGFLPLPNSSGKPITVIGTDAIRNSFDQTCLQQAINSRLALGVSDLVLNPDGHAPIGCVLVSPTHIYPGPVGVDIKCSMSLLQLDIPEDQIIDRRVSRALIMGRKRYNLPEIQELCGVSYICSA